MKNSREEIMTSTTESSAVSTPKSKRKLSLSSASGNSTSASSWGLRNLFQLARYEMLSVESFIDLVKKRDIGRLKFNVRERNFDINSRDEDGRTALHHAIMEQELIIAQHLVDFGCDVNIKDDTPLRESPLHVALRLGHLEAAKMLLEAPTFDVTRCDALQRKKMLPETSLVDDVYAASAAADSDSTLTKRRSFGDQYILFARQNTRDYLEQNFPIGRESVRDMVLIQDSNVPCAREFMSSVDQAHLSALYVVDSTLSSAWYHNSASSLAADALRGLKLSTLVLSRTRLRKLPASLFDIDTLQILKVDQNQLTEIPTEISKLKQLRVFCCDRQRPRLRTLPHTLTQLEMLQVLSFTQNALDSIAWVVNLPRLKVLRCAHNRLTRLPIQLANLHDLMVLDVSHNRLHEIPSSFAELIRRLYFFGYYNRTLKPSHILQDKSQLLRHLELQQLLASTPQMPTVRDISVAVVGESHSGKTTLVEALKADKGICKFDLRHGSAFDIQQFEMHTNEDCCYVSTLVLANDILDNFCRNIHVDLYLLVFDLTSLELHNGSQHLFQRHVNRMQMWLEALYEIAPHTPALIVGTHADSVKSMSFNDIWRILENFMDLGRGQHLANYSEQRHPNCLLCNPRGAAVRHVLAKSRSGSAGFVDLSYPPSHGEPMMNGHVPPSGETTQPGRFRFPHVVGYYEIDSKKHIPKDAKKSNISIEQLKGAIMRMTASHHHHQYQQQQQQQHNHTQTLTNHNSNHQQSYNHPEGGAPGSGPGPGGGNSSAAVNGSAVSYSPPLFSSPGVDGVPASWLSFVRHITEVNPHLSCMPYEEVMARAKSYDISSAHVPYLLQYFHNRGKLVFFGGDDLLAQLVVINPTWFIQVASRVLDGVEGSRTSLADVTNIVHDRQLDVQLQRAGLVNLSSTVWLLAALQKIHVFAPFLDTINEKLFLFPNLLEIGNVSCEIWPDMPEWDENQVTYEFAMRRLKPCVFADFILHLNAEGRRELQIVGDPAPVFLAHIAVFYSALDVGGCDECGDARQYVRTQQPCLEDSYLDDVLHKVHVHLLPKMDAIRVTVRGKSPCCTMHAVLEFMQVFLDDAPDMESAGRTAELRAAARHSNNTLSEINDYECGAPSTGNAGAGGIGPLGAAGGYTEEDEDLMTLEDRCMLLCPKCVIQRHSYPDRLPRRLMTPHRKAICSRWHNLGSWTRSLMGDYRPKEAPTPSCMTVFPEYEHPRLILILPPSAKVSRKDWNLFSRMKFLEGFEVHFLCEYTAYWHLTDEPGFRLNQSRNFVKRVGNQLPKLLNLALTIVQMLNGVHEHAENGRMLTPVIEELLRMYEYLSNVDTHIQDPYTWLSKNKDRVVNMLTKVLANANDGLPDLYFKVGNAVKAENVFRKPTSGNRYDIARFLRIEASSGSFGPLRPLYVGNEVRWLCDTHYEELRNVSSK